MSKFYSLKKILAKNAIYNIIFGQRSNGKTYAVLEYAIKNYFENGAEFAYIRRWREDIIGRRASDVFSAINNDKIVEKYSKGKYQGITYWAGKFYFCIYDENGKAIYNTENVFGYTFALSDNEHNKSISYPKIKTILFDEFLTKKLYLPDEFVLFMNTLSTIIRKRNDVKIFMLGNTVNDYSPYFKEMGLEHIKNQEQGTIELYTYGKSDLSVAVEYCNNYKSKDDNNFYFAFNNPKLHMITSGAWELDIFPHCPIKFDKKNIIFIYFIEFENEIYQCEIVEKNNNLFTYIHLKTTPLKNTENDLIYSLDFIPQVNYNRYINKPDNELKQKIWNFFIQNKVYYQDNKIGNSIQNYINICKKGG